jgi:hypothetical protein
MKSQKSPTSPKSPPAKKTAAKAKNQLKRIVVVALLGEGESDLAKNLKSVMLKIGKGAKCGESAGSTGGYSFRITDI